MSIKLFKGLTNDRKSINDINRTKLVSSIIGRRMFIVPDEFAKEYVNESVMSLLLDEFCDHIRKTSTHSIMHDKTIGAFSAFYSKMDKLHPELKLFSSKYLKKIDSIIVAVLLLTEERHWGVWLKYNKQCSGSVHGIYLLINFYLLDKQVPRCILEYFVLDKKKQGIIESFFESENKELCDKLIRDIEKLGYPHKFAYYLFRYWSNQGTYFPEKFEAIKPYLGEGCKALKTFMGVISTEKPSLGFETFKALESMMSGLEPEDDDDVSYSFTMSVTNTIDHLFGLAWKDINILWALPMTNIPPSIYQNILRDGDYRNNFYKLMESSDTPLENAKLYYELFGYKKYLSTQQLTFIRRGGSLKTLILDDTKANSMYNVCYKKDGLCELLTYSNESDILYMINYDETFREFILSEMSRCNLNYLNDTQLRNLFKAILDSDTIVYKNMYVVANYIFKLLGESRMLSEFPSSMKLFLENRMSRLLYPDSTKYINSETLPYIPIRLLSGVIVDRCLSANVLDGTKPPVLNTEFSRLDWVMTTDQLNSQLIGKGNVGYIADLSPEAAEHYISVLTTETI